LHDLLLGQQSGDNLLGSLLGSGTSLGIDRLQIHEGHHGSWYSLGGHHIKDPLTPAIKDLVIPKGGGGQEQGGIAHLEVIQGDQLISTTRRRGDKGETLFESGEIHVHNATWGVLHHQFAVAALEDGQRGLGIDLLVHGQQADEEGGCVLTTQFPLLLQHLLPFVLPQLVHLVATLLLALLLLVLVGDGLKTNLSCGEGAPGELDVFKIPKS